MYEGAGRLFLGVDLAQQSSVIMKGTTQLSLDRNPKATSLENCSPWYYWPMEFPKRIVERELDRYSKTSEQETSSINGTRAQKIRTRYRNLVSIIRLVVP